MTVTVGGDVLPLSVDEVNSLWQTTRARRQHEDVDIGLRCVSEAEIQDLNKRYRQRDESTNALTFSYPSSQTGDQQSSDSDVGFPTHDIVLCLAVAEREAEAREMMLRDYAAWLLVHAFLHVTGLDHESSDQAAASTTQAEVAILAAAGYQPTIL